MEPNRTNLEAERTIMTLAQMRKALAGEPFPAGGTARDANGRALMYLGPDGVTAYRNGYPVGIYGSTNPQSCDGTCRANCTICGVRA